jgi:Protein of unknown function (DUF1552)
MAPRLSRRTVLRGMGATIALPLMDIMTPIQSVRGSTAPEAPLRILFFNVPNGAHMPAWTPKKEGKGFELPETLKVLDNHRKYLTVLTGLTLDGAHAHGDGGGDHARSGAAFLTGAHPRKTDGADIQNSVSVDQVAAAALGAKTRLPSLELGLEGSAQAGSCDSGYSCAYSSNLSWRNSTSPLAKEINPAAIFDRLFTGENVAGAAKNKSQKIEQRKSILDFVQEDAKDLQRKLGAADQRKLDEYLYAIRDVENRIVKSDKLRVGEDGIPNYPRPAGVPREWDEHCKLMMDMTALAIQSDSTRVVTFMYANEGSNRGYPEIGAPEGHHDLSHHGKSEDKQAKVQKINAYHLSKFANFIDQVASIQENGTSLLDNCLILYGSGISDGDRHNHNDLPIILLGRAGGRLEANVHVRYPDNTPLCNLYLWMLHQVGIKADSFGDSNGVLKIT